MTTEYKKFKDECSDDGTEPPPYCSEKAVIINQPGTVEPMGEVIYPKAGWTICCSVFTMCCCFQPLGIAALVLAIMASSQSDYEAAKKHLKVARKLNCIGVGVGIVIIMLVAGFYTWYITQELIPMMEEQNKNANLQAANNNQQMENSGEYASQQMP